MMNQDERITKLENEGFAIGYILGLCITIGYFIWMMVKGDIYGRNVIAYYLGLFALTLFLSSFSKASHFTGKSMGRIDEYKAAKITHTFAYSGILMALIIFAVWILKLVKIMPRTYVYFDITLVCVITCAAMYYSTFKHEPMLVRKLNGDIESYPKHHNRIIIAFKSSLRSSLFSMILFKPLSDSYIFVNDSALNWIVSWLLGVLIAFGLHLIGNEIEYRRYMYQLRKLDMEEQLLS